MLAGLRITRRVISFLHAPHCPHLSSLWVITPHQPDSSPNPYLSRPYPSQIWDFCSSHQVIDRAEKHSGQGMFSAGGEGSASASHGASTLSFLYLPEGES